MSTDSSYGSVKCSLPQISDDASVEIKINVAEKAAPTQQFSSKKKEISANILVTFIVAATWTMSTQFSKLALNINKKDFYAPYFMMWLNTCFMIFCYPCFCLYTCLIRRQSIKKATNEALMVFKGKGITVKSLVMYVLPFLVLWTLANYSYARSLGSISPAVATSISSCNTAFVYALSMIVLHDKFCVHKLISVICAISGVVILSFDGEVAAHPVGILLCVISASSAAMYKVFFKKIIVTASFGQVSLFMSFLGLMNIFLNAIGAFGLLLTPWEWISIDGVPWLPLFATGLLSLIFNFTINFGIAVLHPLVISVGMLLGIPFNTIIDIIFHSLDPTGFFIGGTGLITISFVLIIIPISLIDYIKNKFK